MRMFRGGEKGEVESEQSSQENAAFGPPTRLKQLPSAQVDMQVRNFGEKRELDTWRKVLAAEVNTNPRKIKQNEMKGD